jgi:hypothetical protein
MMDQPDPTLIFLNNPKAGGSTLHHVLDLNCDHTYTITVYRQIPALTPSLHRMKHAHTFAIDVGQRRRLNHRRLGPE